MRVLVTRPEPGCSETATRLEVLGHQPVKLPLMSFQPIPDPLPDLANFAAIAFSSTNALSALRQRGEVENLTHLPAFTVGSKTAALARAAGFTDITNAEGTVGNLADTILAANLDGPLLYPAARHRAGDLETLLERGGQKAETIAVYEMTPNRDVGADAGPVDIALFYSRRTAEAFVALPNRPQAKTYLCLSANVAAPLRDARVGPVHLAKAPNEDAIFAALLSIAPDDRKSL